MANNRIANCAAGGPGSVKWRPDRNRPTGMKNKRKAKIALQRREEAAIRRRKRELAELRELDWAAYCEARGWDMNMGIVPSNEN